MARKPKFENSPVVATISVRVPQEIADRYEDVAANSGVSRSDILRFLLTQVNDEQIEMAVAQAKQDQILSMRNITLRELKQKREAAVRQIAYLDSEFLTRSEAAAKSLSKEKQNAID